MGILAVTFWQGVVTTLLVLVCLLLMMVILIQKGRGGGLAGAFGGAGGHSAFGAKTGDVFTWITVGLTFLFVLMAIVGVYTFVPPPTATPRTAAAQPAGTESGEVSPEAMDETDVPPAATQPG